MLLSFFIGLLTAILVLDCLFLLLLILIQLPKKEAGLGQAFGSSATDALFGAGSGTALTKMTKYAAGVFFAITLLLAILNAQQSKNQRGGRLREAIDKAGKAAAARETAPVPVTPPATSPPVKMTLPVMNLSNVPAAVTSAPAPASNVAAARTNVAPATTNVVKPPATVTNLVKPPAPLTNVAPAATNVIKAPAAGANLVKPPVPATNVPAPASPTNKPAAAQPK